MRVQIGIIGGGGGDDNFVAFVKFSSAQFLLKPAVPLIGICLTKTFGKCTEIHMNKAVTAALFCPTPFLFYCR